MSPQRERPVDSLWWNTFRCGIGLIAIWLGVVFWLARPAPAWNAGLEGGWADGRMSGAPGWRLHEPTLSDGASTETEGGTIAWRTGPDSWIDLGHLGEDPYEVTWSGWWRVDADSWPQGLLTVASVESDRIGFQLGFDDGRARLRIRTLSPDARWRTAVDLASPKASALRKWVHLAVTSDGQRTRLYVDGEPVAERDLETGFFKLGRLRVMAVVHDPEGLPRWRSHGAAVLHDGLLLHGRRLGPSEIRALCDAGRHGWPDIDRRLRRSTVLWRFGWPVCVTFLAVAIALRAARRWNLDLSTLQALFRDRAYRAVRWVLGIGILSSALLTGGLWTAAFKNDLGRLELLVGLLDSHGSAQWKKLDLLLVDARSWLAGRHGTTLEEWENWLDQHHYPADFRGVRGIGFARRIHPRDQVRYEEEISARHGFRFLVRPLREGPRSPLLKLDGNPLLPVELYKPEGLEPMRWRSNDTILGRDLLSQSLEDVRPWSPLRVLEEALVQSETRVTALERIAPESWYGSEIQGLRLFVPWRRNPASGTTTPTTRLGPDDWEGVLFANVDFHFQATEAAQAVQSMIGFRVVSGDHDGARNEVLFDSARVLPSTARPPGGRVLPPVELSFFHRSLWLEAWTTEAFERDSLRRWVWPAGGMGLLLTGLAAGLVGVQIASRERQGLILGRLQEAHSELQAAQLQRTRLSRDLHDSTLQNLYAVGLHLRQAAGRLPPTEVPQIEGLRQGEQLVQETIVELREFLGSLREEGLAGRSFGEFVGTMLQRLGRTTGVGFDLRVSPSSEGLTSIEVMHLANIVREAISNALRHGRPSRVTVSLEIETRSGQVRLEVKDDGTGFDASRVGGEAGQGQGLGLRSMQERAEELGGTLTIQSEPGSGTALRLEFLAEGPSRSESRKPGGIGGEH